MPVEREKLDQLRLSEDEVLGSKKSVAMQAIWAAAVICISAAIAIGWWLLRPTESTPQPAEAPTTSSPQVAASPKPSFSSLHATGYVVARRIATVASEVTGRLVEINFDVGDSVNRGQLLARLEDRVAKAEHDLALASRNASQTRLVELNVRLAEAESSWQRLIRLNDDSLVSQTALDAAAANVAALRAKLEALNADIKVADATLLLAEAHMQELEIRAPFSGVVVSRDAQVGETVSPVSAGGGYTRTGITTIVDMGSLEIEIEVNELYIERIMIGQKLSVVADAYPGRPFEALVSQIVPTADRQKATISVQAKLIEHPNLMLLPNMVVKTSLIEPELDSNYGEL